MDLLQSIVVVVVDCMAFFVIVTMYQRSLR